MKTKSLQRAYAAASASSWSTVHSYLYFGGGAKRYTLIPQCLEGARSHIQRLTLLGQASPKLAQFTKCRRLFLVWCNAGLQAPARAFVVDVAVLPVDVILFDVITPGRTLNHRRLVNNVRCRLSSKLFSSTPQPPSPTQTYLSQRTLKCCRQILLAGIVRACRSTANDDPSCLHLSGLTPCIWQSIHFLYDVSQYMRLSWSYISSALNSDTILNVTVSLSPLSLSLERVTYRRVWPPR